MLVPKTIAQREVRIGVSRVLRAYAVLDANGHTDVWVSVENDGRVTGRMWLRPSVLGDVGKALLSLGRELIERTSTGGEVRAGHQLPTEASDG